MVEYLTPRTRESDFTFEILICFCFPPLATNLARRCAVDVDACIYYCYIMRMYVWASSIYQLMVKMLTRPSIGFIHIILPGRLFYLIVAGSNDNVTSNYCGWYVIERDKPIDWLMNEELSSGGKMIHDGLFDPLEQPSRATFTLYHCTLIANNNIHYISNKLNRLLSFNLECLKKDFKFWWMSLSYSKSW